MYRLVPVLVALADRIMRYRGFGWHAVFDDEGLVMQEAERMLFLDVANGITTARLPWGRMVRSPHDAV